MASQVARTIRRSSRRDSKIPQACPAGFLCFVAGQSGAARKAIRVECSTVVLVQLQLEFARIFGIEEIWDASQKIGSVPEI